MKKTLYLVRNKAHLTCTWLPTGNAKRPLACVWVGTQTPQTASDAPSQQETGRLHLCA
jgi:hypothetical protein